MRSRVRSIAAILLAVLLAPYASVGHARDPVDGTACTSRTNSPAHASAGTSSSSLPAHTPAWTLNDFVAATQILSNIGVLIALVVTLRQLSSSIREATSLAMQSNAHALNQFYVALATSQDLAAIYQRGREDPLKLTQEERARFFYACVAWFAHHEQSFGQVQSGLLPTEFFRGWELALREDLRDAGLQWYWNMERRFFDVPFRKLIDRLISEIAGERDSPATTPPVAPPRGA